MSQSSTSTCSTANDVPENIKDDIIRAADDWDLAKNKYYLNLQRKLHEKSASLERMRAAYIELVQELGEEAFDLVPDHYNIREPIAQFEEAKKILDSIS